MYYSAPKKKSKSSQFRATLLGALFLLIFIFVIAYGYFQTSLLRITRATIAGDEKYKEPIEAFVTSRMPFFFLSATTVQRELQAQFPQIRELTFTADVLHNSLEISYTLREAHFLWCSGLPERLCYLADPHGVIFEKSDEVEHTLLTSVEDNYFENVAAGRKIPLSYIESLMAFENILLQRNLRLMKFTVNAPFSLFASFVPGIEVRFSMQKDIKAQIEKLAAFLSSRSIEEVSALQYIDLRIENRIYYR